MVKTCSKCSEEKDISNYGLRCGGRKGHQAYCNDCRNQYRRELSARKRSEGWDVYILPEENYAGLSSDVAKRIINHRLDGKNTNGWYIHSNHERPEHAIIAEALLHLDGYNGCTYKNK